MGQQGGGFANPGWSSPRGSNFRKALPTIRRYQRTIYYCHFWGLPSPGCGGTADGRHGDARTVRAGWRRPGPFLSPRSEKNPRGAERGRGGRGR